MQRYFDVNLLETDNGEYVGFCRLRKKWKESHRPKNFAQQDYTSLLKVPEALIRNLLKRVFKEEKKRILSFRTPKTNTLNFREIDFVGTRKDGSLILVEFKFGRKQGAERQLKKTIEIARHRWPNIYGFTISTYTKNIFDTQDKSEGYVQDFENFEKFFENLCQNSVGFLEIDGIKFLSFASKEGWIDETFLPRLRSAKDELENPLKWYSQVKEKGFNKPFSDLQN